MSKWVNKVVNFLLFLIQKKEYGIAMLSFNSKQYSIKSHEAYNNNLTVSLAVFFCRTFYRGPDIIIWQKASLYDTFSKSIMSH